MGALILLKLGTFILIRYN